MADPQSPPRYAQISALLVRDIAAGRLLDGERLPPERELAASLGISVGTLRRSLADLKDKGMLRRVQGSGNYVTARAERAGVYAFFRLELRGGGGVPSADVIDVERQAKPDDLPDFGQSPEAHRIRRLRWLNEVPVALEEIWLDGAAAKRLQAEDLGPSMYQFYRRLGIWIARAEDQVGVAPVPDWAAAPFEPTPGSLQGYVERLSWSQDGRRPEFSRTWFDNDKARYVARLK